MLSEQFIQSINSFNHFPQHILDGEVDESLKGLGVFDLVNKLAIFKNADHKLTDEEEEVRDQLTYRLFISLRDGFANNGARYFEFVRPVLPTRYARKFCQFCIETRFALPTYYTELMAVGRALGWQHEVEAIQYLQQQEAKTA